VKTLLLYLLTAVAEIVGCYLPYLWLREAQRGCCCRRRPAWRCSPGCCRCIRRLPGGCMRRMAGCISAWRSSGCGGGWHPADGVDALGSAVALAGMAIIVLRRAELRRWPVA
jgi:small multidrug resistance family-3 protein